MLDSVVGSLCLASTWVTSDFFVSSDFFFFLLFPLYVLYKHVYMMLQLWVAPILTEHIHYWNLKYKKYGYFMHLYFLKFLITFPLMIVHTLSLNWLFILNWFLILFPILNIIFQITISACSLGTSVEYLKF